MAGPSLPPLVPYDQLVVGTLYQVDVVKRGLYVTIALPYQGTDDLGRLIFATGPNGIWVHPEREPRIREFDW